MIPSPTPGLGKRPSGGVVVAGGLWNPRRGVVEKGIPGGL